MDGRRAAGNGQEAKGAWLQRAESSACLAWLGSCTGEGALAEPLRETLQITQLAVLDADTVALLQIPAFGGGSPV